MARDIIKKIFIFLVGPALLVGTGWYAKAWKDRTFYNNEIKQVKLKGFKFISPLIDVELPNGFDVRHEPIPFKANIEKFVEEQINLGHAREISVYFRDLSDGPWFGINENIKYNPASLMKVPIMVAWLKRAEKDPNILKLKITFDEKSYPNLPQGIKPAKSLIPGVAYTVEDLLRYMMCFSDNKALWLLHQNVSQKDYNFILERMDVNNDQIDGVDSITAHSYSGFLRILYNASFLSREMSEKALELMSFQDFPQGMAAGIPKGVLLASKFGEFPDLKNPGIVQLHEFGIVYHPNGPYILGILTRGFSTDSQANIIKSISQLFYNSVKKSSLR